MTEPSALPLQGPSAAPVTGEPPARLVVLLHGYGADGNDLIALAPVLAPAMPDALFLAPHAPEACEAMPFGRQWFSFTQYDPDLWRRDPANLGPAMAAMADAVAAAAPPLDATLDGLLAAHGLGPERLALVGFSQGTMMALQVALRRPDPVAAVIGFSGALPGPGTLAAEVTARPPVTLIHGEADPVVPFAAMAQAEAGLRAAGVPVRTHGRPGLDHGIDPEGVGLALSALRQVWPDLPDPA